MFGDPVANPYDHPKGHIGDMLESANYGTSKKSGAEGQWPVLRMNNITYTGGWNFNDLKYSDFTEVEQQKYLVKNGEILFNRTNSKELVGKTAVYRRSEPMAFAGYLVRARVKTEHNPEYISGYMNSLHGKLTLQNMCKNIVGMANINAKEFQSIKILIPPKAEQDNYARVVHKSLQEKTHHEAALAETETLFSSLQQRAFNGNL
jgi:type I restriction enzyme S subunit